VRNVLITGGSRGIGKAMVEVFSAKGYRVAFTYKNSEAEALELSKNTGAVAIMADSSSEAEIKAAIEAAAKALGGIDILINNAGIASFGMIQDIGYDEWQKCLAVNLTAPFIYSREVLPYMMKNHKGRIINISSMWGLVGASCEVPYSATKAAVIGFTKALAKELAPSNIQVNAIACGVIDTDMNRCFDEEEREALMQEIPADRFGKPQEVAKLALQLCEGNEYLTGQIITLDGGWM
jgi:3-oxoacyl-[acyl-carrier protein] reductase